MLSGLKGLFGRASRDYPTAPTPRAIYAQAIATRLQDSILSDEEFDELKQLRSDLTLTDEQGREVYLAETRKIVEARMLQSLADGALSPDEDADLADLAVALRLSLTFDPDTLRSLELARKTWSILNNPLPVVFSPLGLQRGEVAHLALEAEVLEERTRTRAVTYGGPTLSIPVMGGLRFRMGHMAFAPHAQAYLHSFGVGQMVLTNRRLLFASPERALTVKLENILDIEGYLDGVRVTRTTGKPHLYRYVEDRNAGLIISRAWFDARQ